MRKLFIVTTSLLVKVVLGVVLGVALSRSVEAQSSLDTPLPGDFLSGIGYARGWKCTAGVLTFTVDNGPAAPLSYGSSRADTQGICGHSNTGFIAQENWNLVGTGQHTIRVFDNGVQFAEATFTVSTFSGEEFLRGASRTLTLGFGGCHTILQWQESQQNFAIAATDTCFQPLLGQWEFVTQKPGEDERNHYVLLSIETRPVSGEDIEGVVGLDLDHGGIVALLRLSDVLDEPVGYDFGLASLFSSRCEAFYFNQVGPDLVQGIAQSFPADPVTGCQVLPSPPPAEYPMTGTRTATPSQQQTITSSPQTQVQGQAQTAEETSGMPADLLEKASRILRQVQP